MLLKRGSTVELRPIALKHSLLFGGHCFSGSLHYVLNYLFLQTIGFAFIIIIIERAQRMRGLTNVSTYLVECWSGSLAELPLT